MRTLILNRVIITTLFFVSAYIAIWSIGQVRTGRQAVPLNSSLEALYLPNPAAVKALSFGYGAALSHLLWFDTISYFGKHYKNDQSYPWLYHMCNLVTELNPSLLHVYTFCGTMLSWEASEADRSLEILTKGEAALPASWELPYLVGFTYYYFKKDPAHAAPFFLRASQKESAPIFLKTLAAKTLSVAGDDEEAISFLTLSLQTTPEGEGREALRKKLAAIISKRDLPKIEEAIKKYYESRGIMPNNINELMRSGYLTSKLQRPGPGQYVIDNGRVSFQYGAP